MGELLTPRDVARLLRDHGLAPRKRAGQNFVVDPNTVRRIVAAAGLAPNDRVLEFGPGLGSLTLALADAAAEVVAVEVDAGFVPVLHEVLDGLEHVTVVHADALRIDLDEVLDGRPARLVANLPYNVATPLLFHALACPLVADAFVMVQREVGERWSAHPGDAAYSGVSLKLAVQVDTEVALTIPRAVFHPVPNVDSVMVRVTRRADAPPADRVRRVATLVDTVFAQRRKTLRTTLRPLLPDGVAAEEVLARAGIDPGARPETLGRDDVLALDAEVAASGGRFEGVRSGP
jgi:16S rRNA (adenine1518-N6/adenine1519-N6)-dimethyltransferase